MHLVSTMSHADASWEVRFSNSKKLPYFYNPVLGTSMWEMPQGMTEEQARQLPGGELLGAAAGGEATAPAAPAKVRASHLLIKHRDSRRPSSWKEVCFQVFHADTGAHYALERGST